MTTRNDYLISILIGFFVGIFIIPVLLNIGIRNQFILLALPWVVAVSACIGMWITGGILAKKFIFIHQFAKFAVVGVLNTAIDFGVLNFISLITGVTSGFIIGGVNVPGVALAIMNAYFWNKFWVFKSRGEGGMFNDFPKFLLISGIGIIINSSIVIFATSYPIGSMNPKTWLNFAKVLATVFSFIWNFLGYKFIVFKSSDSADGLHKPHEPIAPL